MEEREPARPDAFDGTGATADAAGATSFLQRAVIRRRVRFLRGRRELALHDLGGFVFEAHRLGEPQPELLAEKLAALSALDGELAELQQALALREELAVLHQPGIAACPHCGAIHDSAANFCPGCGTPVGTPPPEQPGDEAGSAPVDAAATPVVDAAEVQAEPASPSEPAAAPETAPAAGGELAAETDAATAPAGDEAPAPASEPAAETDAEPAPIAEPAADAAPASVSEQVAAPYAARAPDPEPATIEQARVAKPAVTPARPDEPSAGPAPAQP
jgi:hypothetical protein